MHFLTAECVLYVILPQYRQARGAGAKPLRRQGITGAAGLAIRALPARPPA
jgi:hypothetical protein